MAYFTHVSGIAASNGTLSGGIYSGIAPQSNIISLKILDEAGHGTPLWALEAIRWLHANAAKYNIRVVNMSIGTSDSVISSALSNAVKGLYNAGITIVAAAGNENHYRISAPGTSRFVITVGAVEDKTRFKFRNGNSYYYKPDIFAPSENIVSCCSENFSFNAANRSSDKLVNKHYISMSGTSMATPMVSACAALLYQYAPSLTPGAVKRILSHSARQCGYDLNIENIFYCAK